MSDVALLEDALTDLRAMLAADGYVLAIERVAGDTVGVSIAKTSEACEECLVHDSLIVEMALAAMRTADATVAHVDVVHHDA